MSKYTKEQILQEAKENGVEFIRLQFTDLWDLMRLDGVTELPGTLSKVATGIGWGLSIAGGAIIVGWAIIAVVAGIAINHLFTKLEIGGNTIEGHLNDFVDWLIFWD